MIWSSSPCPAQAASVACALTRRITVPNRRRSDTPFRQWINRYMAETGFSDAELARLLGISSKVIWKYKNGQNVPSYETFQLLKTATGCDMNDLF